METPEGSRVSTSLNEFQLAPRLEGVSGPFGLGSRASGRQLGFESLDGPAADGPTRRRAGQPVLAQGQQKARRGKSVLGFASTSATLIDAKSVPLKSAEGRRQGHSGGDQPTMAQLMAHPVALVRFMPKKAALFVAGAVAGAAAKTITAPLDRVKLMMQTHGSSATKASAQKGPLIFEAFVKIFKEEGAIGYWKGNTPQVLRIIPYSAVQLFAYESYKKAFQGEAAELSVPARLAAGACAGMTSTLVTYPMDVLRLRLAVDPLATSLPKVALQMAREEGLASFYRGLGPSLLGIAPYIAINFCVFDLIKKAMPEDFRRRPIASALTAVAAATVATVTCYPLDTVRRQLQMKSTPFTSVLDAFPGIIERDGISGLYRGFVANALKNLPNSSIRLTTYDAAKNLINVSQSEYDKLVEARRRELAAAGGVAKGVDRD